MDIFFLFCIHIVFQYTLICLNTNSFELIFIETASVCRCVYYSTIQISDAVDDKTDTEIIAQITTLKFLVLLVSNAYILAYHIQSLYNDCQFLLSLIFFILQVRGIHIWIFSFDFLKTI